MEELILAENPKRRRRRRSQAGMGMGALLLLGLVVAVFIYKNRTGTWPWYSLQLKNRLTSLAGSRTRVSRIPQAIRHDDHPMPSPRVIGTIKNATAVPKYPGEAFEEVSFIDV